MIGHGNDLYGNRVEVAVKVKKVSDMNGGSVQNSRYQMMQGATGIEGSGSPEEQRPLENPRIIEEIG